MTHCKKSKLSQVYYLVHSKQLMLTAPTEHCTLPFCSALCSVHLVGSVVVERDLVLECDDH